jgi:hypothetical protein
MAAEDVPLKKHVRSKLLKSSPSSDTTVDPTCEICNKPDLFNAAGLICRTVRTSRNITFSKEYRSALKPGRLRSHPQPSVAPNLYTVRENPAMSQKNGKEDVSGTAIAAVTSCPET